MSRGTARLFTGRLQHPHGSPSIRMRTASFALPHRHAGFEQQGLRLILPSVVGLYSATTSRVEIGEGYRNPGPFCALPRFP